MRETMALMQSSLDTTDFVVTLGNFSPIIRGGRQLINSI